MFNLIDSKEQITLARLTYIIKKYARHIVYKNGEGENFLECVGLSSFVNEYRHNVEPIINKNGYPNDNYNYNPGLVFQKVISEIKDNEYVLSTFLNEFFKRLEKIEDEDFQEIQKYLELMGYKLEEEVENPVLDTFKYTLKPFTMSL